MRTKAAGLLIAVLSMLLPGAASAEPVFWLDTPPPGATVAGLVEVAGWVLDERGVTAVDLYVDGVATASADLNLARWDVMQAYPWYMGTPAERPGFRTGFDASQLTDGAHSLFIRVEFADGEVRDFGQRTVTVDGAINQPPFGEIQYPGENQPMNGVFPVMGWALDDGEVEMVEILVDGLTYSGAIYGEPTPEIRNRFPSRPDAARAGFLFNLNTSRLTNGLHTIAVRVWDTEGASRVIGRRRVQVFNNWRNLVPFGMIEYPPSGHVAGALGCGPQGGWSGEFEDPRTVELVTGWVLDPDDGVKWVELLINGTMLARTTLPECWYYPFFGMDVNCYGLEREDVLYEYHDVPNAIHAGFSFVFDVSDLILNQGYHQGLHYLTVRAGDIGGQFSEIGTIPIIFDCDDDPNRPTWGDIWQPEWMERVQGTVRVSGWALDFEYLESDSIEIWVDGIFIGRAIYGLPSPDVQAMFPWFSATFTRRAGWEFDLDTTLLSDGEHQLVVIAEDYYLGRNVFAQRPFVVDNLNRGEGRASGEAATVTLVPALVE